MSGFEFDDDLGGLHYQSLISASENQGFRFSLTLRNDTTYEATALAILDKLNNGNLDVEDSNEWPGTTLLEGTARIYTGPVDAAARAILSGVESLFAWQNPDAPEDLAFYSGDEVVFYATSHERTAWIDLDRFPTSFRKIIRNDVHSLRPD